MWKWFTPTVNTNLSPGGNHLLCASRPRKTEESPMWGAGKRPIIRGPGSASVFISKAHASSEQSSTASEHNNNTVLWFTAVRQLKDAWSQRHCGLHICCQTISLRSALQQTCSKKLHILPSSAPICLQGCATHVVWSDSATALDSQVCVQVRDQVETGEVVVTEYFGQPWQCYGFV